MKNPGIFQKINAYLYDDTRALDRIYNNIFVSSVHFRFFHTFIFNFC